MRRAGEWVVPLVVASLLAACSGGGSPDPSAKPTITPRPTVSSTSRAPDPRPSPASSQRAVHDAEIEVGAGPGYATVGAGSVWVGNHVDGSVSRINPGRDEVVSTITIDGEPTGMLFAFGDVWTFGAITGLLHRIDPRTEKVVATVRLEGTGGGINGLAAGDSSVWVSESSGLVYRIDPVRNRIVETVRVLKNGCSAGGNLTYASGTVWYACWDDSFLWKIDPGTHRIVDKIQVGGMAGSPAGGDGLVWVPRMDDGMVLGIDPVTGQVERRVDVGSQVEQLRITGRSMWVRVSDTTLAEVDLRRMKVINRYELPAAPIPGGGLTLGFGSVWAVNFGTGTISRINVAVR